MLRGSRSRTFFFWTLTLPWDLAAAQAGVFLGALLQERPHEGRPAARQLPGRLRGASVEGVKCLEFCVFPRVPAVSARTRNPAVARGLFGTLLTAKVFQKKQKKKNKKPQNQTKYQGAHVETGRSWRVRGAREVSVPRTPRSQIFRGGEAGASLEGLEVVSVCQFLGNHRDALDPVTPSRDDCDTSGVCQGDPERAEDDCGRTWPQNFISWCQNAPDSAEAGLLCVEKGKPKPGREFFAAVAPSVPSRGGDGPGRAELLWGAGAWS